MEERKIEMEDVKKKWPYIKGAFLIISALTSTAGGVQYFGLFDIIGFISNFI